MEGLEVGGDFYDVFAVDGGWMLVIGDVCGKGAEAASVTALIRYAMRAAAVRAHDPAEVLNDLNAAVRTHDPDDERFATVQCIRLDLRPGGADATVACAGHPPAIVVRDDATVTPVGEPGLLVGSFDDIGITSTTVSLQPGDVLVALTDGVLEARDRSGRQFDEVALESVLRASVGQPVAALVEAVEAAAVTHQGGLVRDDIAIIAARVATSS